MRMVTKLSGVASKSTSFATSVERTKECRQRATCAIFATGTVVDAALDALNALKNK